MSLFAGRFASPSRSGGRRPASSEASVRANAFTLAASARAAHRGSLEGLEPVVAVLTFLTGAAVKAEQHDDA